MCRHPKLSNVDSAVKHKQNPCVERVLNIDDCRESMSWRGRQSTISGLNSALTP
jgi:hypothetical protein